uniref:30S ribosomal protein 3, chloroplastic n=1 Tax=Kalanchoe fedtschenkoi TaxID=63787 RepID=A0A7N0ZS26_KALFE
MMSSMSIQTSFTASFKPALTFPSHKVCAVRLKSRVRRAAVASSSAAVAEDEEQFAASASGQAVATPKLGVVVKPIEKPRLVLKFIWMEKNIGLALDQKIPGHGTVPLSPYYFWPRKDAWEELKVLLESKPWISQKQMIILLNQATDIINLWQQSGGNLSQS